MIESVQLYEVMMEEQATTNTICNKGKKLQTYRGQGVINIHMAILIQATGVGYIHECFPIINYQCTFCMVHRKYIVIVRYYKVKRCDLLQEGELTTQAAFNFGVLDQTLGGAALPSG